MFSLFIISLLGLCIASIAIFIATFRSHSRLLIVFVPLIAVCGSFIYFSYISVLGYPVRMEWESLPKQITVIYFRVANKDSITLWLFEKDTTRLVELPYIEAAEDGLEAERQEMGKGIPVTFKVKGKPGKNGKEGDPGEGNEGENGNGEGNNGSPERGSGWRYEIESYGEAIPGGSLPPK